MPHGMNRRGNRADLLVRNLTAECLKNVKKINEICSSNQNDFTK